VLQVEEQELAICSGRRSINKNTTLKEKRECIARSKKRKREKMIYRRSRNAKKEEEKKRRVRRCTKHIV